MDTEESLLGFQQQDVTELCFGMYPCWCVDKYLCMQIDLETGLQVALMVKNPPEMQEGMGLIPGSGTSPGV